MSALIAWEGIAIEPFYMPEHISYKPEWTQLCQFPTGWALCQDLDVTRGNLQTRIASALLADVDCVVLTGQVSNQTLEAIGAAAQANSKPVRLMLAEADGKQAAAIAALTGVQLMAAGTDTLLPGIFRTDSEPTKALELSPTDAKTMPARLLLSVRPLQNAGATAVQQLGSLLAAAHAYMQVNGLLPAPLLLEAGLGRNLLLEVAKLRAVRHVFARYAWHHNQKPDFMLLGRSIDWNKTMQGDVNANQLRATAEAMAGVLGGADFISLPAYAMNDDNGNMLTDGEALARNIQHVLRHEAHLGHVADPLAGAYFIEGLTHEVADKAWQFFEQIETAGGLASVAGMGFVRSQIAESAAKLRSDVAEGKLPLLNYKPGKQPQQKPSETNSIPNPWNVWDWLKQV